VSATKHNLANSGPGSFRTINEDQICVFCHTPHQANFVTTDPLWNHSASTFAGSYGVYGSTTLNATGAGSGVTAMQGNGTELSNLCMSCHDGTQAVNALYNNANDTTNYNMSAGISATITTNANIGTSLGNDHPVNFTYDLNLANSDGGLVDPTSTTGACVQPPGYANYSTSIGKFTADYSGLRLNQKLTPGNQFQCSSCHGAHIYYGGAYSGYSPFLKVNNVGSGLCLSCHCK
jgi:hypothetical protein